MTRRSDINKKTEERKRRLPDAALRQIDYVARRKMNGLGPVHEAEVMRELGITQHLVSYWTRRLAAKGIFKIYKVGSLTFMEYAYSVGKVMPDE